MASLFDHIRVACRQQLNGVDDIVNVLHFRIEVLPTPNNDLTIMQDLAEFISTAYAEIEALITNAVDPVDLTFYNLSSDSPMGIRSWGAGYAGGTGSGEALPVHDSALVLFSTNVKRCQGRIYLPPFTEAANDGGGVTASAQTSIENFSSALLSGWTGAVSNGEYVYGIYRRSTGGFILPNGARTNRLFAVQKRRRQGRGS